MHQILQPEGWAKPVGYSNGMAARGRLVFTGGQVGWNARVRIRIRRSRRPDRPDARQYRRDPGRGGRGPQHVTSMTWYVADLAEYREGLKRMGPVYRDIMGRHFPPMAVVEVTGLVEPRAKVEIQATAVIPD